MKFRDITAIAILGLMATGCATTSPTSAPVGENVGHEDDAVIGVAAADSGFSRLTIGMDMQRTQDIMGRVPDRFHTYESGKRWIPFYFGTDARRMQVLYKGEGCLIFTGGNAWGGGGGELIQVENDPSGACYQP